MMESWSDFRVGDSTGTYKLHDWPMENHDFEPWDQQTVDHSIKHHPSPRHINRNFWGRESFLGITVI